MMHFLLLQDAFGNYVVQYVLELGQADSSRAVMESIKGHFAELSMQKFSSRDCASLHYGTVCQLYLLFAECFVLVPLCSVSV